MNKVTLIGRLTKDPELKFTPSNGTAVATFTLAVDRRFKKEGQQQADFINIVVWNKAAEYVANYSGKGKMLAVAGRIETRSYDAKDGSKRYVTEVIAEEVKVLEWNNSNGGQANNSDYFGNGDMTPIDDGEDMPFN